MLNLQGFDAKAAAAEAAWCSLTAISYQKY